MAPDGKPISTRHRQLAPTVGPSTYGVSFREGILGGIGETITVGTVELGENNGYIVDNNAYMPANDHLVSVYLFPMGDLNIFIGMTAEALGLRGGSKFFRPPSSPSKMDSTQDSDRIWPTPMSVQIAI